MTVHEAVRLVLAAGGVGRSGEVLVLDMGQPTRIADVATRVAASAGRAVEIVYTGLRPGEKLHEVLFDPDEVPVDSSHRLIAHVPVPPLASAAISQLDPQLPGSVLVGTLRELALGSHAGSAVGQVRALLCAVSLPARPALSGATWHKLLSLRAMRSSESTASPLTTGA
jgi:hypothetical protein